MGRFWKRMQLWATKNGLAMQPLNQSVERSAREGVLGTEPHFGNVLQTLVGDATRQTLLTFRVGDANDAALHSPRRDINAMLLK